MNQALISLLEQQAWHLSEARAHLTAGNTERADHYIAMAARMNANIVAALKGE